MDYLYTNYVEQDVAESVNNLFSGPCNEKKDVYGAVSTVFNIYRFLKNPVKALKSARGAKRLTNKEAQILAKELGASKRIPPQKAPFNSHGQPIFKLGNKFITPDADQHKGGVWKMFDKQGRRLGTYDQNLNRIGE